MAVQFRVVAGYDAIAVNLNIREVLNARHRGVAYDSIDGGKITVCGNGPSLLTADIPRGQPIAALNGAFGVLLQRGIVPDYAICYDPTKHNAEFYRQAPKQTTYLIASRCDPAIFKALEGRKVRVWHVFDEPEIRSRVGVRMIGGGSTVGLKSLNLLYSMGYDEFDLIGYDSCLSPDRHHASDQPWNDTEKVIMVGVGNRAYRATHWMAAQAQEALEQFRANKLRYSVNVHGNGLIAALVDEATMHVDYDLARYPPTYNSLEWALCVDIDREARGFSFVKVRFPPGPVDGFRDELAGFTTAEKQGMLDNVCRPMLRMFGYSFGGDGRDSRVYPYVMRPAADAFKRGIPLPCFEPGVGADRWAAKLAGKDDYITITLREARYWLERNSDLASWQEFAKGYKGRVIFVRDTAKADEPLPGFETCPTASYDLRKRTALYKRAKMNFFIANGPAMLAVCTQTIPYVNFIPPVPEYPCFQPEWLRQFVGIEHGGQWPWATERQRAVWQRDTLDNIRAAASQMGIQ